MERVDYNLSVGKMTFSNGAYFEGMYKDRKRNGKGNKERVKIGTYFYTNGDRLFGEWKDDVIIGIAAFYMKQGGRKPIKFEDGQRVLSIP